MPRWYGFPKGTVVTLSSCSDARDVGYGASAYFHAPGHNTAFVAAKGKVIGKKPLILRSELQALIVSCRLAKTILKETEGVIAVGKVVFWVNSTAVYIWVKNDKERYVPFVANRLAEVHDTFNELKQYQPEIRYVKTKQNRADLLMRPRTVDDFKADFRFWIQGPNFLTGGEESWPAGPEVPKKEQDLELRKMFIINATVTSDATVDDDVTTSSSLVEYAEKKGYVDVTAEQLQELEKKIVREAQQAAFAKDIAELMALPQPKDEGVLRSKIFTLGQVRREEVFLDNKGLLPTVTRLDNATFVSPDEKRPLLLPSKHPLTQLLVREYHWQAKHSGPKTTFALMARRYSLPLSAVNNVTYKCQHCRERMPIPVKHPQAALHENRLQAWTYAFHNMGMDHFGPFEVQRAKKVWALLLICLTTGAVHCEPLDTLSVGSHFNALDRFVARRRKLKRIRSDQGRTFNGGAKDHQELTKALAEKNFQGQLAEEVKKRWGIEFVFNVEYMPHHGGRWERMVKEFKRIVAKAVDSVARMTYDTFATLLSRAKAIINQPPIAIDNDLRVITPMQLLQPASAVAFGFEVGQSVPCIHAQVRQSVEHFWKLQADALPGPALSRETGEGQRQVLQPGRGRQGAAQGQRPLVEHLCQG